MGPDIFARFPELYGDMPRSNRIPAGLTPLSLTMEGEDVYSRRSESRNGGREQSVGQVREILERQTAEEALELAFLDYHSTNVVRQDTGIDLDGMNYDMIYSACSIQDAPLRV
jgi:hypothetical protein